MLGKSMLSLGRRWAQSSVRSWVYKQEYIWGLWSTGYIYKPCKDGQHKIHTVLSQSCHWEISAWLLICATFHLPWSGLGMKFTAVVCSRCVCLFVYCRQIPLLHHLGMTTPPSSWHSAPAWYSQILTTKYFLSFFAEVSGDLCPPGHPRTGYSQTIGQGSREQLSQWAIQRADSRKHHFRFSLGICTKPGLKAAHLLLEGLKRWPPFHCSPSRTSKATPLLLFCTS